MLGIRTWGCWMVGKTTELWRLPNFLLLCSMCEANTQMCWPHNLSLCGGENLLECSFAKGPILGSGLLPTTSFACRSYLPILSTHLLHFWALKERNWIKRTTCAAWEVLVAQLVERLLSTPEVCGSNPVIAKLYNTRKLSTDWMDENKGESRRTTYEK